MADEKAAALCYDVGNLIGNTLGDLSPEEKLDVKALSERLKTRHLEEAGLRKEAKAGGVKKPPKLTVYWQLMKAIDRYAGHAAKVYADRSFEAGKGMAVSNVRSNISGSAKSYRWNKAVAPSPDQRVHGATGEPRYKKRAESFPFQYTEGTAETFRLKRRGRGHQIYINPLHEDNRWMDVAYHRPIPDGAKIKQMTVKERAGHFFAALSCEVPDSAWMIPSMRAGWRAGIDPGAKTALTIAFRNSETSETRHAAIDYRFLEEGLAGLERLQQCVARKRGPRRKRTPDEVAGELAKFSAKKKIKGLSEGERTKRIEDKEKRLSETMIRQGPSKSWRQDARRVAGFQYRIANQRMDALHKISRALAQGCDLVGIEDWEPVREISYRKKRKALKKDIKAGVQGAEKKLKELEAEKTKSGRIGVKKIRRGGRDRSIATFRTMLEEKARRAGTAVQRVPKAGTTYTCSRCGEATGPRGDPSVREWTCVACGAAHDKDLNSAFNVLKRAEDINTQGAVQAPAMLHGHSAASTSSQGTQVNPAKPAGSLVTGMIDDKGGSSVFNALPGLWEGAVPGAFKSLLEMGYARSLSGMKETEKTAPGTAPRHKNYRKCRLDNAESISR
ncbi:MAG: transposase [Deltaproteobacteria bacterium]|nr:transposase [Deltaproteobacteria bacterium]